MRPCLSSLNQQRFCGDGSFSHGHLDDQLPDLKHLEFIAQRREITGEEATATSDAAVWAELEPLAPCTTVHLKRELEKLLHRPLDLEGLQERMNCALRQAIPGRRSTHEW